MGSQNTAGEQEPDQRIQDAPTRSEVPKSKSWKDTASEYAPYIVKGGAIALGLWFLGILQVNPENKTAPSTFMGPDGVKVTTHHEHKTYGFQVNPYRAFWLLPIGAYHYDPAWVS